jgi:hypothetical protein
MRIHKGILAAGIAAAMAGIGFAAMAQSVNPLVSAIGQADQVQIIPGGIASARSTYGNAGWVGGLEQYSFQVPLTGFAITIPNHTSVMMINPAGTLATGAFTMEPNPSDGQRVCIISTQIVSTASFSANTGQTIGGVAGLTALAANTQLCWRYIAVTATWYRYLNSAT